MLIQNPTENALGGYPILLCFVMLCALEDAALVRAEADYDLFPEMDGYLWPWSTQVSGVMHMMHNALKDACTVLTQWKWYEARLGALQHFFSQGDRCEALIEAFL